MDNKNNFWKFVRKFDKQMPLLTRKVQCSFLCWSVYRSCYTFKVTNFTKDFFLPVNSTSKVQLCALGIIWSFKVNYITNFWKKISLICRKSEMKKNADISRKISIKVLETRNTISSAWERETWENVQQILFQKVVFQKTEGMNFSSQREKTKILIKWVYYFYTQVYLVYFRSIYASII